MKLLSLLAVTLFTTCTYVATAPVAIPAAPNGFNLDRHHKGEGREARAPNVQETGNRIAVQKNRPHVLSISKRTKSQRHTVFPKPKARSSALPLIRTRSSRALRTSLAFSRY
ncbi:hypothetical protein BDR26DRAFT_863967 [Obelidium mucronatum]|nr:hypothetical protein BDR26DRAFT_863967 [Obelidium mucronatum]